MDKITPKAPSKKAPVKAPVVSARPAAKKTVAKKPVKASPKPTAKTAVANTKSAATSPKSPMIVSDEQRYRMIAEAAYYRAERNQFKSDPVRDWIDGESDIAALLNGVK